jgi:HK97 family phage prohead protease
MKADRVCVPFELKTLPDGETHVFEGYGSVFGTLDSYNDTIVKGAFKQTLKDWKAQAKLPKMLLQHGGGGFFSSNADDMVPIGKWDEMREDDHGLFMRGRLFDIDTDRAKSTYAALKEGELDGLSIGFRTKKFKFDEATSVRTLTEIQLFEVSLVTFPANEPARVTGVKADGVLPSERDFERWLRREAGFTEDEAKTIIAKGYRQVRREAKPSDDDCAAFVASLRGCVTSLRGA